MHGSVSVPAVLDAVTVNGYAPPAVGVPEIVPLDASSVSPGGRAPVVTANVGAGRPVAVTVCE